ncbi:MAG TPA: SUMF1/EgtB/PvdO family nonheme iron enzyme [Steroidobacteraceae bacterium]
MLRLAQDTLQPLAGELSVARRSTDALLAQVPDTALFERPLPERHRIAFYLGHLEAFDVNLLLRDAAGAPALTDRLDRLFAFGIDPVGGLLPSDAVADWPPVEAIRAYARRTRARVDQWLTRLPDRPIDGVPVATLLQAAIEHRWMHAETLAYMLNRLPRERPLRRLEATRAVDHGDMLAVPAGEATLGAPPDGSFAWDNEYPAHTQHVPAFRIDRYMVTNGQFLQFVQAGGYEDARWWSPEDFVWVRRQSLQHPAAWLRAQEGWRLWSLHDAIAFQDSWPVYVSYAEASAYARWTSSQLPDEAQWHRAAYGTPQGSERAYPWGDQVPDSDLGNFDFARWDPMPVNAHPHSASAFGVEGLLGNGWEWTSTPFAPFTGFAPQSFYPGYSADFTDGRHFVLKGGSAHTAQRLLRRSFRNWFQPYYPYPFAGFRCVRPL